jgi:hypothetical protein
MTKFTVGLSHLATDIDRIEQRKSVKVKYKNLSYTSMQAINPDLTGNIGQQHHDFHPTPREGYLINQSYL